MASMSSSFDGLGSRRYSADVPKAPGKKTSDEKEPSDSDEKRKVTLYLPVSQARALKVHAAQHDLDMSGIVSELLKRAGIE
jgi:hypothetical protein